MNDERDVDPVGLVRFSSPTSETDSTPPRSPARQRRNVAGLPPASEVSLAAALRNAIAKAGRYA